ncbi:hypothetical protein LCGC14_0961370 [marine sediment metagenome]|uniref:Bacteriophage tail tape measure N-terminal domain-containing protein n=1 Tax=marine sediment metagenome TaxID=412755 RepID=A0A0F9RKY6_9ZZZZ
MAQAKLEVVINAKDRASAKITRFGKTLQRTRGRLNSMRPALLGVGAALGGLAFASKKAIDAFGVQERAEARLVAGLRNVEGTTERSAEALKDYAAQLQKVTTFGDETIISAMGMLSTFQLNESQIKSLTPRIVDMTAALEKSTGQQQDMESVAIAVGKAMTLGVGSLTRYGVVISEADKAAFRLADTQGKLDIITRTLDKNFKGIAEEVGMTTTGKMKQLGNAVGDLQEKFGEVIAEAITPFVGKLVAFAQDPRTEERLKLIVLTMVEVGRTLIKIGGAFKRFAEGIGSVIAFPIAQFIKLEGLIKRIQMRLEGFKRKTIGKISSVFGTIKGFIPGLAEGGIVTRPTLATVGEKGPEAIIPLDKAGSIGGNTFNFDFSGAFIGDKDMFIEEIKRAVDRESELKSLGGI